VIHHTEIVQLLLETELYMYLCGGCHCLCL